MYRRSEVGSMFDLCTGSQQWYRRSAVGNAQWIWEKSKASKACCSWKSNEPDWHKLERQAKHAKTKVWPSPVFKVRTFDSAAFSAEKTLTSLFADPPPSFRKIIRERVMESRTVTQYCMAHGPQPFRFLVFFSSSTTNYAIHAHGHSISITAYVSLDLHE